MVIRLFSWRLQQLLCNSYISTTFLYWDQNDAVFSSSYYSLEFLRTREFGLFDKLSSDMGTLHRHFDRTNIKQTLFEIPSMLHKKTHGDKLPGSPHWWMWVLQVSESASCPQEILCLTWSVFDPMYRPEHAHPHP